MTPAMAGAIGGALMMCAGVVAMAAMSHCPRRWRVWPTMLLAFGALYSSDRVLTLVADGYLHDARAWIIVAALGSALGTVCVLSWMVQSACPECVKSSKKNRRIPSLLACGVIDTARIGGP